LRGEKGRVNRADTLKSLIRLDRPLEAIAAALQQWAWDWYGPPLASLDDEAVVAVLRRWANGQITADDVEEWANLFEGREDVAFGANAAAAIYDLANPDLQGRLVQVAPEIIARL
jgi:hypothetical protein